MMDIRDIKYVRGLRLICQYPKCPSDPDQIVEWYVDDVTLERVEWVWTVKEGLEKGNTDRGFTPWDMIRNPKFLEGEDYRILEIIYPDTNFDEELFHI